MSNSSLVNYTKLSPNYSERKDTIKKITIHHMAGNLSVETCGNVFASSSRQASSNYGIGSDGRVGMYVEEKNRSWCSSNASNDHQAVTIEVANDRIGGDWHISDTALAKLIELCVDICKRNGIEKLNYTGDVNGNLTRHNMFVATTCPGPYLQSKFEYIAEEVNKKLQPKTPSKPVQTFKYNVGDKVIFSGVLYVNAKGEGAGQSRSNLVCTITKRAEGSKPYNIENGLGWVAEEDLQPYVENASSFKKGDKVKIVGSGNSQANGNGIKAGGIGYEREIIKEPLLDQPNPYCVGLNGVATGWYPASSLQKL